MRELFLSIAIFVELVINEAYNSGNNNWEGSLNLKDFTICLCETEDKGLKFLKDLKIIIGDRKYKRTSRRVTNLYDEMKGEHPKVYDFLRALIEEIYPD